MRRSTATIQCCSAGLDRVLVDGDMLDEQLALSRIEQVMQLTRALAQYRLNDAWKPSRLPLITQEREHKNAYKKARAAYGKQAAPRGAGYYSSRIERLADERAGSLLLSQARSIRLLGAILRHEPHEFVTPAEFTGLVEEIQRAEKRLGYRPRSAFVARPQPPQLTALTLNLAASDTQYHRVSVSDDGSEYSVTLRLPLTARPGRSDWIEHELVFRIPEHHRLRAGEAGQYKAATLRVAGNGRLYCDLPLERPIAPLLLTTEQLAAPQLGLGADYGLSTLLTAAFVRWEDDAWRTDGRVLEFQVRHLQHTVFARAKRANWLYGRVKHLDQLRQDEHVTRKIANLESERVTLWVKVSNLNREIAHLASRWLIDTALAAGCSFIAVEDLSTMRAQKLGRTLNGRLSMQVRGQLVKYLAEKCEREGLELRIVPPRGTSATCSGCARASRFTQHRESAKSGYKWLACACGRHLHRDHNAAINIAARGLTGTTDPVLVRITRTKRRPKSSTRPAACSPDRPSTVRRPRVHRKDGAQAPSHQRSSHVSHRQRLPWSSRHLASSLPNCHVSPPRATSTRHATTQHYD